MEVLLGEEFGELESVYEAPQKKERLNIREQKLIEKGLFYPPVYTPLSNEDLITLFPEYPASNEPCQCDKFKQEGKCECNYRLSFSVDDHENIKKFLDFYGVCVIRLLDEETCNKTIESFFDEVNGKSTFQKLTIELNNPESWENYNWPAEGKFLTKSPAFSQQAYENRTNEKLYKLYAHIFNETKLYCSIDNWGLFRGTKGLTFTREYFETWKNEKIAKRKFYEEKFFEENGFAPPPPDFPNFENYNIVEHDTHVVMDRPDWRHNLKPHWDLNPWRFHEENTKNETQLFQSLVALVDCTDNGSFSCVPGSHTFIPSEFVYCFLFAT